VVTAQALIAVGVDAPVVREQTAFELLGGGAVVGAVHALHLTP